jgi:hypothetical protein
MLDAELIVRHARTQEVCEAIGAADLIHPPPHFQEIIFVVS